MFIRLKMAVFAPIPSASTITAATVNPRAFSSTVATQTENPGACLYDAVEGEV